MRMYVLDENGEVVFEFSSNAIKINHKQRQQLLLLIKEALRYLQHA